MSSPISLSVVIPAYNESKSIATGALDGVYAYLQQHYKRFELILVDDGSTDATLALLQAFARGKTEVKVIPNPHQGKGPTLVTGMLAAQGQWRLFTDMDQSTPIDQVKKLTSKMYQGYDVAIGSRMIDGAKRENNPLYRRIMGEGFSFLVGLLAIRGIRDSQCGFKLFSGKATQLLFSSLYVYGNPRVEGRAFTGAIDVELLYLAQKYEYDIAEVGVAWTHVDGNRVNPVVDSWRMLVDVIKIRLADVRGKYGKSRQEARLAYRYVND